MASCKLNQIFLGEIASIQNYGAFIRIPGCAAQGLIHRSQVSTVHVDDVAEVLQKGERVWCKVISMGEDGKIGLSMKYVNQGNGMDLDPNGIELQRDLQKKKTVGKYESKPIHLEAVLNTTCTKCGTPGHLSKDCFMSPDGKKYELLPEVEEVAPIQAPMQETNEKEKKRKHKKTKKKQKSKKHKQDAEDSESDEKEIVKKKRKKHSKDQKKKKKKKYDSSASGESSSDSSSSHDVKSHKRKRSGSVEKRTKKCKHSKSKYPDR